MGRIFFRSIHIYLKASILILIGIILFSAGIFPARAKMENSKETEKKFNLNLTYGKDNFRIDEYPEFDLKFSENKNMLDSLFSFIKSLVVDEYKNIKIEASLSYKDDTGSSPKMEAHYLKNGRFKIMMPEARSGFRPGKYTLIVKVGKEEGANEKAYFSRDFTWGVLAMNTNKSYYLPAETAKLSFGVLDDSGNTLCNASLKIEIMAPDGGVAELSTQNGIIKSNSECGPNNVIKSPDYSAEYNLAGAGTYEIKLTADTKNGQRQITDKIIVKDSLSFEIERIGPTRIYPLSSYPMVFRIKALSNYKGEFRENIPNNFDIIKSNSQKHEHDIKSGSRILIWNLDLKQGETMEISYVFDAPDISPELFLLGKAQIGDFSESRYWQIASDATSIYAASAGSNVGWTSANQAWDSVNNLYASRSIPGSSSDDSASYLLATSHTATSVLAKIVKVEIGIEGFVQSTNVSAIYQPVFNGITNGTSYTIDGNSLGLTDIDYTFWQDVTSDAVGPGAANWTWINLQNLDVRVYGFNIAGPSRSLYIDQIRLRADYDFNPTGIINSIAQRSDGTGIVDVSIDVNDTEATSTAKAKFEFATSSACDFSSQGKAYIDPTQSNIQSDSGTPKVDNGSPYQIGTTTGWITTVGGSNTIGFDWLTKQNVPNADGTYCVRLTVNDLLSDQAIPATTTLTIDNTNPTVPGQLTSTSSSITSVRLVFAATSTETNFKEYKIYYKPYNGTPVTESDALHGSSTDNHLGNKFYGGATSTIINGLSASTTYSVNIWAYDIYGNISSSTQIQVNTTIYATWREAEDLYDPATSIPLGKNKNVRLRLSVSNDGDWTASNTYFKLEYGAKSNTCANVSSWTVVPAAYSTEHFAISSSVYTNNRDETHARMSNTELYDYATGSLIAFPSSTTSPLDIKGNYYTEIEYVLKATQNAQASTTYCFRAKNGDNLLDSYNIYPELTTGPAPTSLIISMAQRGDASGIIDLSIGVNDSKRYDNRVKIEYVLNENCNFTTPLKPNLDETDGNITAIYGDPSIDNNSPYQIGTSSRWITNTYGSNTVDFDWNSRPNVGSIDTTYCMRLTANDGYDDQPIPYTATGTIDNLSPLAPGYLREFFKTNNSVILTLGTSSTENHFKEYKIFYKEGTSSPAEIDFVKASSSEISLGNKDFNNATSTTITGLLPYRYYVFNIWAYDVYGNKSSSTQDLVVSYYYVPKSENWRWYYDEFNETPTSSAAIENSAPSNIVAGSINKLRMSIKEINGIIGNNVKMRLQYSIFPDFSSDISFVGESSSSSLLWVYGNGADNDGDPIIKTLITDSQAAAIHNESGVSSSTYNHQNSQTAEWEFTIKNNGAATSTIYYFRAWDSFNNAAVPVDVSKSYPSLGTQTGSITYDLSGLNSGTTTEGVITNISTTANSVPFGVMLDSESIGAYRFNISTNAGSGYSVYVSQNNDLRTNGGSIILPIPHTNENPDIWPILASPSNYGYHSGDSTLSNPLPSRFLQDNMYAKFENNLKEVGYSPIPINNDIFDLVFRAKTSDQQPAGDYQTQVKYIIVPLF